MSRTSKKVLSCLVLSTGSLLPMKLATRIPMSRKRIGSSLESVFTCFVTVSASLVYDTIVVARVFTLKFDVFSLRVMVLP